jgi:hypothetical protein
MGVILLMRPTIVNAIFLTARDANLHFEPLAHLVRPLEVLCGGVDVPLDWFLGQINHVGGKERLFVLPEESLVCVQHAIEPRQELL